MSRFLPIFILSIFADVVCNNSIARIFNVQIYFSPLVLTVILLVLQMLAAPLQAGFSDFYLRKKGLMIALACSLLSMVFFSFAHSTGLLAIIFLWIGLLTNSSLGNTTPIIWSALADEQKKNLRFSLALTTSAYPIGYIMLALLVLPSHTPNTVWILQDVIIPSTLLILSFILVWKYFLDAADKKTLNKNRMPTFNELARSELFALSEELRNNTTRFGLLSYFLWAASQYGSLLTLVNSQRYAFTVIVMMCGYFVGVAILGFYRKMQDEKIIKIALIISVSSQALFFVFFPVTHGNYFMLSICCFFYTLGNAFLSPSIFSLFSKERGIHQQGKAFGLIISADSAGFLVGVIAERVFNYMKAEIEYIVLFSFIVFLMSLPPYIAYKKRRKDAARISNLS